jgi:hypothetical protein
LDKSERIEHRNAGRKQRREGLTEGCEECLANDPPEEGYPQHQSAELLVPGGVRWRPGGGHLSWECDDRWLVASMGNTIIEVWPRENRTRLVCVPNTQHEKNSECEPESSPDGTKFGFASTMLGDLDFYVAVQRLPDPPQNRIDLVDD